MFSALVMESHVSSRASCRILHIRGRHIVVPGGGKLLQKMSSLFAEIRASVATLFAPAIELHASPSLTT
jgi:hypothetical protein